MGKIIAVVNEKGGVAKTTTVKNMSVGLANQGKKVLAVDLDPSANLTVSLGLFKLEEGTKTILDLFRYEEKCDDEESEAVPEGTGIIHHEEGIDLIPSIKAFHDYEPILQGAMMKETYLKRILAPYKNKYDYIFIDCPAGLGIFVTNAMYAADSIIIPVQPHYLSAAAMMNLFTYVKKIRRLNGTGTDPKLAGILFTMVKTNVNNDNAIENQFRENYAGKHNIYKVHIPNSVRFSESDGEGLSIFRYAPNSSSASIYNSLVQEFLKEEGE